MFQIFHLSTNKRSDKSNMDFLKENIKHCKFTEFDFVDKIEMTKLLI